MGQIATYLDDHVARNKLLESVQEGALVRFKYSRQTSPLNVHKERLISVGEKLLAPGLLYVLLKRVIRIDMLTKGSRERSIMKHLGEPQKLNECRSTGSIQRKTV
jgi:hypothetical protein